MGRPPLPLGTYGKVLFRQLPSGQVLARVKFRDFDGRVRLVSKTGRTRAGAERALKTELTNRQAPGGAGALTADTKLAFLADAWLAADRGWSTGTQRTYRSIVSKQVKPTLGQLRLREISPGLISRSLTAIAKSSGPGAAKSTRACLSGMFALAVEDGAVSVNPVRDASARISNGKKSPRALTAEETDRLVGLFRESEKARSFDLPDLVDWMLATGCRIGEALALRYALNGDGKPILDLTARTWEVNGTVVRIAGSGLAVQPRPKTKAGWRVIAIPDFAMRLLERRRSEPSFSESIVFSSPHPSALRDPANVSGVLRQLLDSFECDVCAGTGFQRRADGGFMVGAEGRRLRCAEGPWSWVTSHTFRKTVATRLDEAGLTPRQVADQLGHANPSMTLDVYFGRQVVSADAARVLNR
jgi:integrase